MKEEKGDKGFLEIEWKKFILPIFLIILFGYQVYAYFSIAHFTDDTSCYLVKQKELMDNYYQQNNTKLFEKTISETESTLAELNEEFNTKIVEEVPFLLISSVSKIYPFFPISCEVEFNPNKNCRYYSSKESYDCMLEFVNSAITDSQILSIFNTSLPEYKKVSTSVIVLHFILIFIWGYLISAIILFAFRSIRKKIKSH